MAIHTTKSLSPKEQFLHAGYQDNSNDNNKSRTSGQAFLKKRKEKTGKAKAFRPFLKVQTNSKCIPYCEVD